MIQLKHGIHPSSLSNSPDAKRRKGAKSQSMGGNQESARRTRAATGAKGRGLRFERVFSDPTCGPFDQIEWEKRTAEITDDSGKVIFKQENIEVPKAWSALATKIAVSK